VPFIPIFDFPYTGTMPHRGIPVTTIQDNWQTVSLLADTVIANRLTKE